MVVPEHPDIAIKTVPVPAVDRLSRLILKAGEIQVWRHELPGDIAETSLLQTLLSSEEKTRAARFKFERHHNDFIFCRGTLRSLLGGYLDTKPKEVRFEYSPYGKPHLAAAEGGEDIEFNLSHTDGMAVFAFARHRKIGIDVERIRSNVEVEMISRRFFSTQEQSIIASLPSSQQHEAFFRCWTRKEAYIKALGEGLSMPLDQFTVAVDGPAKLLRNERDNSEVSRWRLFDLSLGAPYAAAVALEATAKSQD